MVSTNPRFVILLTLLFGLQTACETGEDSVNEIVLTAITPEQAAPGDSITLTGKNLGKKAAQVYVGGVTAEVVSWSPKEIKAILPALGAASYPVFIQIGKWKSNELTLVVTVKSESDTGTTLDRLTPETTLASMPLALTNQPSATFTFSGTDNVGVDHFECQFDGGAWQSCTSPQSYASLAAGTHGFGVRAVDKAGNADATPPTFSWKIDLTPPDTSLSTTPAPATNGTSALLAFNGTDDLAVAGYQCSLDSAAWQTCTSPQTPIGLLAGVHTYDVRAIDTAGNIDPSPATTSWTIDLTAPDTTIVSGPPAITSATNASFVFGGSDNIAVASYQCRLDAGAWVACNSPKNYLSLATGPHTLDVRAIDSASNADLSPASWSWAIDQTPPDTTITSSPAAVTNATTASFSFNGTDNVAVGSYQCRLDAGAWGTCTSPKNYTSLTAGAHTSDVRAVDTAGNIDLTPATAAWVVDTTLPNTSLDSSPPSVTNATTASFFFSGTDNIAVGQYQCRLDAGAWAVCTSAKTYTSLTGGAHTFDARSIDTAGNVELTPETFTWTVDLTAPNTTMTGGPAPVTNATTAVLSFTGDDNIALDHFECRLDGSIWQTCTSPHPLSSLATGAHAFEARAMDSASNADMTPSSWAWTIDQTPPDTTITSSPAVVTNATTASFSFNGTDNVAVGRYDCRLDAGAWTACTSPKSFTGLADGSFTFDVRAVDTAWNIDLTPETYTWRVDLTAPATTMSSGPGPATNGTTAVLSFTGFDNVSLDHFECQMDGGIWQTCTSPQAYSPLLEGSHDFNARAIDTVGNIDMTPATWHWTVDLTPPDSSITSAVTLATSAVFAISGTDDVAVGSYDCRLDVGAWAACTSPKSYTGLVEGAHTFYVRAVDTAGNIDLMPATWSWTSRPTPWIDQRYPNSGTIGTSISLVGAYFGTVTGTVSVGGTPAIVEGWSPNAVQIAVGPGASTGAQKIVLTDGLGQNSNSMPFTIRGNDMWIVEDVPEGRRGATSVWTGKEMVVWGGRDSVSSVNTGGRYNPSTDSWTSTAVSGAPTARFDHTAVWTGSQMVVWGGVGGSDLNTGGRYNPSTDSWTSMATPVFLLARRHHTAVWTGTQMIVWGGANFGSNLNTGGRYNPNTNSWMSTATSGAPPARLYHTAVWTGSQMVVWGGNGDTSTVNTGGRYDPSTNIWLSTSTTGAPTLRYDHTAVWTGSQMVVWGGINSGVNLNTGGRYDPSTDSWVSTATSGAPTGGQYRTAVWTGSQMVIWGSLVGANTGGLYNPSTDSWTSTSTASAPFGRGDHTAVWTGSQMIIWGGFNGSFLNTGGLYAPSTDSWTSTSITSAPAARYDHTAVWTGSQMVVWGGIGGGNQSTGGRYNPSTDSWTSTAISGAPLARRYHTAVWTGSQMVVWGGIGGDSQNTGGRFDPSTDSWMSTSITGAPEARYYHSAVWTGSQMVVWGGYGGSYLQTGGRYDPSTDSWASTSITDTPTARFDHTAVWTGSLMIVWGGSGAGGRLNSGGRYTPNTDTWASTVTLNAPTARQYHTAVWTGSQMVVWGGTSGSPLNTGGRYDPGTDSWTSTSTTSAPVGRGYHTAVWTDSQMVVWGGSNGSYLNTGGRYNPSTDSWASTPTSGSPSGRHGHTMVWIGSEMVVWGGDNVNYLNSLGRYVP